MWDGTVGIQCSAAWRVAVTVTNQNRHFNGSGVTKQSLPLLHCLQS